MKPIKVCHITHGIVGSGVEQVILNYCSRMSKDIQFDVLYQYEPKQEILAQFEKAGFNCIQLPSKVKHPFKHVWTLYKVYKQNKYDVIHSHLDWYMNSYTCFLAMLAGVKKRFAHSHQVYHPKNVLFKAGIAVGQFVTRLFATKFLACGKDAAIGGYGQKAFAQGKVTIVNNAIDVKRFRFDAEQRELIRKELGIAPDTVCIGHIGRFFPQKNHSFLIDVFAEHVKNNPNSKLLLIGDGPLLEEIKQKVQNLGLTDKVIFAGVKKDTAPYYNAMDVFCLPSLWEGLPVTLIEAQYNGLHIITSSAVTDEVLINKNAQLLNLENYDDWIRSFCMRERTFEIFSEKFDINHEYLKLGFFYGL